MFRFLFFIALPLLSANSYALSADDYKLQERMEFIITAFPWVILFFLAINSISGSKYYRTTMLALLILITALSFAWLTGHIEL